MANRVSGKRYAQALFELAIAHNQTEKWGQDLDLMGRILQVDRVSAALKDAKVPLSRKIEVIDSNLQEIDPRVRNLGALLVTRNSLDLIDGVHAAYLELVDHHMGRQRVTVTSAVPLTDPEQEKVRQFVADLVQKEVVITAEVDEDILGGIIIQVGDQLLDGSTRAKLDALRRQIRAVATT